MSAGTGVEKHHSRPPPEVHSASVGPAGSRASVRPGGVPCPGPSGANSCTAAEAPGALDPWSSAGGRRSPVPALVRRVSVAAASR